MAFRAVRPALIDALSAVDAPFRQPRLMLVLETRADVGSLGYAIRATRRLYPTVMDRHIAAALRLVTDRDRLGDSFEGWLKRAPVPPSFQPLATTGALREAANRYQDCLTSKSSTSSPEKGSNAWIGRRRP